MNTLKKFMILILILFIGCIAKVPPETPQVNLQEIEGAFLEGKWDKVINYGEKHLEVETDNVVLRFVLSTAYYMKGKYELQEEQLALVLKDEESKDAIIAWCKRLVQQFPHNQYAHLLLGSAHRNKDEMDEAIESYNKAIEINPNFADAYMGLGTIYYENGEIETAINHFQKAAHMNPRHIPAHYNLGLMYVFNGQIDEAIASFEKTVEIKPNFTEAYVYLGDLYLEKDDRDRALEAYKKVIELDPDGELGLYARDVIEVVKEYLDEGK